jgi:type I restriction enzyme S subunit
MLNLVPKLRFKEFNDDWENKILIDICKKISQGGTPSTSKQEYWNGDIEWLTPAEMSGLNTRYIKSTNRKITKKGLKKCSSSLLPINSVILSTRAPIGHILINKKEMAINQGCKALIPNINYNFLYYYLLNNIRNLNDLGAGNTFKELSAMALKNFPINLPKSEQEQQKIANCLSSLDNLITVHSQKHEALKAHKKGLMQQLFPQEGEKIPRLRFKEFSDDWEYEILGEVVNYKNGKAHEQDIVKSGEFIVVNSKFISTDGIVRKFTNSVNLLAKKDDILMVLSDVPNGRAIAKCFIVDADNKYTVNQRICKLSTNGANSIMLFHSLNRASYFLDFDDGVKQTNLRKDDVLNCPIFLPKELKEQQKIAKCLSSIDNLISTQAEKITTLKAHKKGLMQQLFVSN